MINFTMVYIQQEKKGGANFDSNGYITKNITFNDCESEELKAYQNLGISNISQQTIFFSFFKYFILLIDRR